MEDLLSQTLKLSAERAHSGFDMDVMLEHCKLNLFGMDNAGDTLTLGSPKWIVPRIVRPERMCLSPEEHRTSMHRRNPLGSLNLPTEILRMIILQLDLISLRAFRTSNSHFLQVLRNTPEYQVLVGRAPDFCYLLVSTQLAPHFALQRMYYVLTNSQCAVCSRFAVNVFMPGMQRCCPRCLEVDPEFRPITPTEAQRQYGVPQKFLSDLPILETLPGKYSNDQGTVKKFTKKRRLVSRMEARRLGTQKGKDLRWGKDLTWTPGHLWYRSDRNMCIIRLGVLNFKASQVEYGLHCSACTYCCENHEGKHDRVFRRSPYCQYSLPGGIDVEANEHTPPPEHYIESCAKDIGVIRLYSKQTLLEHLQNCQSANRLVWARLLRSQWQLITQPIWTLFFVMLPRLFWTITLRPEEGNPEMNMDVLQASKCDYQSDKLEEAIWTMCRNILSAGERITRGTSRDSRPMDLTAAVDVVEDWLGQASSIVGELQILNRQAIECQARCLSEGDPQNLRALTAMRENFAKVVVSLSESIEGLCPLSGENLEDGSKVTEENAKPQLCEKYNLRSRKCRQG